jgi:glutamine synthetase
MFRVDSSLKGDIFMQVDLAEVRQRLQDQDIDILRLVFSDVLGITRSKDLMVSQLERAALNGPAFCQGTWVTTTRGGVLDGHGSISDGLPDLVTRLLPDSIRLLPWESGVAVGIADSFEPSGEESPVAPRSILKHVLAQYEALDLIPVCGPELEFYLAKRTDQGWERVLNKTGRVYTTGAHVDADGLFLHMMRMIDQLNIGAFAGNHEFSPSQYEINLWHDDALSAADRTFLFKAGVKDIAARHDILATFMGKPWNDEGGSGFHLHFSVVDKNGENKMHDCGAGLSEVANQMIAGVVAHAPALAAMTNPTINAFKRLGPDTLAPYRANWGWDNRSTMIRIPPERGAGTRIELRIGDGAANPYIVIAAVLAAALDGIKNEMQPPAPVLGWSYEDESAEILPLTLTSALGALDADAVLREHLGATFVQTFMTLKRDEVERYIAAGNSEDNREVTRWELEEYIEDY